ncbi:MAG TPA: CBS domain-containing protein [Candidatus Scatomorpha pullicola]|nr:CBS domain-containing protein [Candidatus Scatomorpha pullicola]
MKVSDIMSDRVVTIDEREPVIAAARLLKRMNLGALPVTDRGGKLVGMLTDRDIVLRCVALGGDARTMTAGDVMTRGVVTATPDVKVDDAAKRMGRGQVRRLPVVENGKLVGMLSLADMARKCDMEAAAALADISSNLRRMTVDD